MSGHSKWSTIKRKKGAQDQKKGVLFSKLSRNISLAIKQNGPNPETNAKLRLAMRTAKQSGMPNDNIDRIIEKAKNSKETENLEEMLYDAYGPEGSALLIEVATDNKNRTISEIKSTLNKNNAKLAESGSALHHFQKIVEVLLEAENFKEEKKEDITLKLMDKGAEDIEESEDGIIAYFPIDEFVERIAELDTLGITYSANIIYKPLQTISVGEGKKETLNKLIETIEELDDVNTVYSNVE